MKDVYAYAHTHWDREWYREFEEFRIRLLEVFDDILLKLQNGELGCFYFDGQTAALEDYLKIRPEKTNLVKDLISEKKLFIGPYYCSTDSFLVDAESLIRNLQIGIKYSGDFGCKDFIAYHADTFGHSKYVCEVVKYFKIPNAIFWRGCGELPADFVYNGVNSTYLIQGYFQDFFSMSFDANKKAELLKNTLDKISKYSEKSLLLPLGADHLGCAGGLEEQIEEVNNYLSDYRIILTTPFEYFKNVDFKTCVNEELRENSRNFILPGVYSSRCDLKRMNARLQWELSRVVEPAVSIFKVLKGTPDFQSEIDYAYKMLIKNHAHDSIYGCGIDAVHEENVQRFKKVKQITNALKNTLARDLSIGNKIKVLNLSNYFFSGAVKLRTTEKLDAQLVSKTKGFPLKKMYDINQIPVTEDYTDIYEYLVYANNAAPFSLSAGELNCNFGTLFVSEKCLENDMLRLEVKNGKINLYDKKSSKEYKDFIKIIDRADIGDSYNFGTLKGDKPLAGKIVSSSVIENGNLRAGLKIVFELDIPAKSTASGRSKKILKHKIPLSVRLEKQGEYFDFALDWKNSSKDHILQVSFNLQNPVKKTVSDDLTGLVIREFDADYDIYKHIPAPRGIELKYNTAPFQRFVSAQDFGLITEGLHEYEVFKNNLRLTILRACGTISNPKNPTRGTPAGPPLPTPDLQMLGNNTARFALSFNQSPEDLYRLSEKFYCAATAVFSDMQFDSLFCTGNKNIIITAIKLDSEGNPVLRLVNISSEKQKHNFSTKIGYKDIYVTDALENCVKKYEPNEAAPNSIMSLKIIL